jgi:type I restriction enzyme M protein
LFDGKLNNQERADLYVEGIEKLSVAKHLPELFQDIFKEAYVPFKAAGTLTLFIEEINKFDYTHSEELGNAYEYLLSIMGSQGDAGQFRTPRHIIEFMVDVIDPQKTETVLDPACGTAGFLIAAYKHIAEANNDKLSASDKKKLAENIVGVDISPDMAKMARVNLYLHGFASPEIKEGDTLTDEPLWGTKYDVILANPPFMSPKGGIIPHDKFAIKAKRAEVLFTDYIAEHLKLKGRAAIIVPEGVIFQSGTTYKALRKMLVEDGYLHSVISLPAGVFQPYSGVKTSILILDRERAKESSEVLFMKIEKDGYTLSSQRTENDSSQLPEALAVAKSWQEGNKQETSFASWVTKKEIAESGDYNLTGERYRVFEAQTSNWPIVELEEIAEVKKGSTITKATSVEGNIPVIAGGQQPAYYHNVSNREGKTITVSASGAYAGFVAYFEQPIYASDCSTVQSKDDNSISTEYLFRVLKAQQDDIYKLQKGGGQPHVYPKDLAKFKIPLPPIEVQREIVAELDRYQKIIDGARQVVENYIPSIKYSAKWEIVKLGEVCNFEGGTQPPKSTFVFEPTEGYIRLLQIRDYKSDKNAAYIPKKERHKTCTNEDVMIGRYGPPVFQILRGKEGAYNVALMKCVPDNSKITNDWLFYFLSSLPVQTRIISLSERVRQSGVRPSDLNELLIPVPSLEVQINEVETVKKTESIISSNLSLIKDLESKIKDKISEVWGE